MTTDNEEFIINDMTPELEELYAVPPMINNKYRVYFDPVTKSILSITNEASTRFVDYFEVMFEEVEMFLSGKESSAKYSVFVTKDNKFKIIPTAINQTDLKASVLVDIPHTTEEKLLTIENCVADKKWKIKLDAQEREELLPKLINYKMDVFVTSSNNKNFLYRTITFELKDLVLKQELVIDHLNDIESTPAKISLSTVQFFKSYGLRNVYESEV